MKKNQYVKYLFKIYILAKITIQPTLSTSKVEDTIYFHSAHKESQLRAGMNPIQWDEWTLGREICKISINKSI